VSITVYQGHGKDKSTFFKIVQRCPSDDTRVSHYTIMRKIHRI